jgi:hypothetical protein
LRELLLRQRFWGRGPRQRPARAEKKECSYYAAPLSIHKSSPLTVFKQKMSNTYASLTVPEEIAKQQY